MGRLGGVTAVAAACAFAFASAAGAAASIKVPRPTVSWVNASPHSIPAAGGKVALTANVSHAKQCVFAGQHGAVAPLVHVRTVGCTSGHASVRATVASNRTSRAVAVWFRVTAVNAVGQRSTVKVAVVQAAPKVASPPASPPTPTASLAVETTSVPAGSVGVAYSTALTATGGTPPYSWTLTAGSLPSGLALDATGTISGAPTATGTWTFEAQVSDAQAGAASASYSITVAAPTPSIPTYGSTNWSGYLLTGGTYTGAAGTFNVPTIAASPANTDTSEWVGVDGAGPSDPSLLQAGVHERYSAATNTYVVYAWVEELPAPETIIPLPVAPGNEVTVTIVEIGTGVWNVEVKNDSTGQYYSANAAYAGPGSSAEWIVEAPTAAATGAVATVGVFSPVTFTQLEVDPLTGSLARLVMVQNGVPVAVPSAPSTNGFTVAYGSVTPAAP